MKRLRVTRLIQMEGPEDWVQAMIERFWLQPHHRVTFGDGDRYIVELSRVIDEEEA